MITPLAIVRLNVFSSTMTSYRAGALKIYSSQPPPLATTVSGKAAEAIAINDKNDHKMKRLTFTFDNGPVPGATECILDFLLQRGIKATFFVVGRQLQAPEGRRLAERAHAEGHWIGNHTYSHGEPLGADGSAERVAREIGQTQQLLDALSHPKKFFRPNGKGHLGPHLLSSEALAYFVDNRMTLVTWNNVPRDWEEPHEAWVDKALATLAELPWSLLVLHDQHIAKMMDTLAEFYDRALAMGTEIVQDFPDDCVPLREGRLVGRIDELVTPSPASSAIALNE